MRATAGHFSLRGQSTGRVNPFTSENSFSLPILAMRMDSSSYARGIFVLEDEGRVFQMIEINWEQSSSTVSAGTTPQMASSLTNLMFTSRFGSMHAAIPATATCGLMRNLACHGSSHRILLRVKLNHRIVVKVVFAFLGSSRSLLSDFWCDTKVRTPQLVPRNPSCMSNVTELELPTLQAALHNPTPLLFGGDAGQPKKNILTVEKPRQNIMESVSADGQINIVKQSTIKTLEGSYGLECQGKSGKLKKSQGNNNSCHTLVLSEIVKPEKDGVAKMIFEREVNKIEISLKARRKLKLKLMTGVPHTDKGKALFGSILVLGCSVYPECLNNKLGYFSGSCNGVIEQKKQLLVDAICIHGRHYEE
uniref:Uncharacterized protein n=1 Tax=Timema genevievae TaxID=629358 RepID=A0A7R9JSU3_TIMGE|nr:unnamed protein product [Timema genevievae]